MSSIRIAGAAMRRSRGSASLDSRAERIPDIDSAIAGAERLPQVDFYSTRATRNGANKSKWNPEHFSSLDDLDAFPTGLFAAGSIPPHDSGACSASCATGTSIGAATRTCSSRSRDSPPDTRQDS
ncbi:MULTISPECIES: hypothetical protein [unclassified Burkholderia]|uniref:hypothetical protein n=1 Tax=unclassified Burkholderia TaxID=2613784 RepID=UPI000A41B8FC|nr:MULTISPECIES: hypothetical protein [unclassified Burkholderia]